MAQEWKMVTHTLLVRYSLSNCTQKGGEGVVAPVRTLVEVAHKRYLRRQLELGLCRQAAVAAGSPILTYLRH
jgi:hypothetical protein